MLGLPTIQVIKALNQLLESSFLELLSVPVRWTYSSVDGREGKKRKEDGTKGIALIFLPPEIQQQFRIKKKKGEIQHCQVEKHSVCFLP